MTVSHRGLGSRLRLFAPGSKLSGGLIATVLACGVAFGAIAGQQETIARLAIGGLGGLLFFLISTTGQLTAARLVIFWLVFLGLVRRLLIPFAGWSPADPLLLIGPGCALLLWMNGRRNVPKRRDAVTVLAFMLLIPVVGQLLNPRQDILTGAKGLMFWLPPLIWLFAGRTFSIDWHKKLTTLVIWLSLPVALHGLYHTSGRFLPFEYTWVGVAGFGPAIFYPGFKVRPFSTLTSPQEYGIFLAVALVFLWGTILAKHSHLRWRVAFFVLLIVTLFLQGTRSTFALFLIAFSVMTLIWSKSPALKMGLVACAVALVGIVKMDLLPTEYGDGPVASAVEHQVSGFQRPEDSTAGLHKEMAILGLKAAWDYPLGHGTALTTRAAGRDQWLANSEVDMVNFALSFGVPSALLFVFLLMIAFATAGRRFRIVPSAYSISSIGVLIAVFGNIWNGGLYTVSAILWLTIGGLARPINEEIAIEDTPKEAENQQELLDEAA